MSKRDDLIKMLMAEKQRRMQQPTPEAGGLGMASSHASPQVQQDGPGGIGEMISNIPGSAAQFASDVTAPIHSPVQTATGLYGLAKGAYQRAGRGAKGLALGPDEAQKLEPGDKEGNLEALGNFLSDRYGGLENIKKTLTQDPVGFAADIAGLLTGGGTMAARVGTVC